MQSLKGLSKSALTTDKDIKTATKPVGMHSYKYSRGSVLIVVNSMEWYGAGSMAAYAAENALAALRSVSGFVTIAAPKELFLMMSKLSPVFVLKEIPKRASDFLAALPSIKHDTVILGPGIQPTEANKKFVQNVIKYEAKANNTIVIDAGVIGLISKNKKIIDKNMIITPHDGEFRTLTGIDLIGKGINQRISAAKAFAKRYKCTIVLKGHETVITDGNRLKVNIANTPVLSTMGTGDVLSGMIASYASQHEDRFASAVAAVRLHSIIGDLLYRKSGLHITALDVIGEIPKVLKRFDKIM